jgi:ABC-type glycerol-3-phosphate transport system substrate-binding protein
MSGEFRAVPFGDLLMTIKTQASSGGPTSPVSTTLARRVVRDGGGSRAEAYASDIRNWPTGASMALRSTGATATPTKSTLALNHNKGLFEEAGTRPPATWEEPVDAAQKLTVKDGDRLSSRAGHQSRPAGVVHLFYRWSLRRWHIVDGTTPTGSGATAETLAFYESPWTRTATARDGIADANTAGPFMDNHQRQHRHASSWPTGGRARPGAMGDAFADVATAPIPVGPNGEGSRPVSYEWLTMVNGLATPEQQDAAWRFLQYLHDADTGATGSGMGEILIGMGIIPSRTSDTEAFAEQSRVRSSRHTWTASRTRCRSR